MWSGACTRHHIQAPESILWCQSFASTGSHVPRGLLFKALEAFDRVAWTSAAWSSRVIKSPHQSWLDKGLQKGLQSRSATANLTSVDALGPGSCDRIPFSFVPALKALYGWSILIWESLSPQEPVTAFETCFEECEHTLAVKSFIWRGRIDHCDKCSCAAMQNEEHVHFHCQTLKVFFCRFTKGAATYSYFSYVFFTCSLAVPLFDCQRWLIL